MNLSRPVSTPRAIWLFTRLAVRRQLNLWQSIRLARKKKKPPEFSLGGDVRRTGTPSKPRGISVLSVIIFLFMGVNGFNIGAQGLSRLANVSNNLGEATDRIVVSRYTESRLVQAEDALRQAAASSDEAVRKQYTDEWNRYIDQVLEGELRTEQLTEEEEQAQLKQMREVFAARGAQGFTHRGVETIWVTSETWPRDDEAKFLFFRSVSIIALVWMGMMIFVPLGLNNRNLGQLEWSFEWMFTFPVPGRAVFASRIFGYSTLNPLVWLFFLPFLILTYIAGGAGWMAVPLGVFAMLYLSFLAGSITTILELALRKYLSLSQIKNVQALCTVFGTAGVLLCYASSLSKPLDEFLVRVGGKLPEFLVWNPVSLPLILGLPGSLPWQKEFSAALMAFFAVAAVTLTLAASDRLTRDGLVKAGGPYQGTRRATKTSETPHWLRGIAANEILLLLRDRNLFVQVLIVPLLLPAYFLLINPKMISAVTGNFRHGAVLVFGIGAYSFLSTAMQMLNREDKTLWYLLCFPQSLDWILRKKAMVWAAVGTIYAGGILLLLIRFSRHLQTNALSNVALALYGIALYSYIASGIGILATDVLESERRARIRVDMVYLYMFLAAMYANTIYSASVWSKLGQLVLSTLLAVALWQKVRDVCPYLLDPQERPPRTVSLSDGMIAALAFFVVQALLVILLKWISEVSVAVQITMAYSFAGLIVGTLTLLIFWRQGVVDLWEAVGLSRKGGPSASGSMLYGIGGGAIAALGAIVYLRILHLLPQWPIWKQDAEFNSSFIGAGNPLWLIGLAVVAAPLFEEFLFRGLIFQGLRRSTTPAVAVLGSAAVFALIHPPIAVIPVFGLGIVTAISFQRTGFLLTPIMAHAVYNACVVLFNRL